MTPRSGNLDSTYQDTTGHSWIASGPTKATALWQMPNNVTYSQQLPQSKLEGAAAIALSWWRCYQMAEDRSALDNNNAFTWEQDACTHTRCTHTRHMHTNISGCLEALFHATTTGRSRPQNRIFEDELSRFLQSNHPTIVSKTPKWNQGTGLNRKNRLMASSFVNTLILKGRDSAPFKPISGTSMHNNSLYLIHNLWKQSS